MEKFVVKSVEKINLRKMIPQCTMLVVLMVSIEGNLHRELLDASYFLEKDLDKREEENTESTFVEEKCRGYNSESVPSFCADPKVGFGFTYKEQEKPPPEGSNLLQVLSYTDRVINGYNVARANHPWVVSLKICRGSCFLCGGSILDDKTVLTAAHCVNHECDGHLFSYSIRKQQGFHQSFRCVSNMVFKHPTHDLAIIKVKHKIRGGVPISMPKGPEEAPKPNDRIFVLGWGRKCNTWGKKCLKQEHQSEILQGVIIGVVGSCPHKTKFCAGGYDENGYPRDACAGDSGTTVECSDKDGKVYLCGVVSSGPIAPLCGKRPGHYAKITEKPVLDWIKQYADYNVDKRRNYSWERSDQSRKTMTTANPLLIVATAFLVSSYQLTSALS